MNPISSHRVTLLVTVAALAIGGAPAWGQRTTPPTTPPPAPRPAPDMAQPLPTADQVINDYIVATGGRAAYEKTKTQKATGTFSIPKLGVKGTLRMYSAAPRKTYMSVTLPGVGTEESGTDGEMAWRKSAATGARILEGVERADMLRRATFNADLAWKKLYKKVEVVGREKVNGEDAYKLVFTSTEGTTETRYYDVGTHLAVKIEMVVRTQMGELPVAMVMSDYKTVGGVAVPMKTEQTMMGMTQVMTLDKVEFNSRIPAGRFAVPADIKALARKQKK